MTGVDSEGDSVSNKDIFSEYSKLKIGMDDLNQSRILTSMVNCLDITEDQYNQMSGDLSPGYKKAISNLKYLGFFFAEKKSKNRRQNKISKEDFKVFKNSTSQLKYKTLRSTCLLESLVEKCSNNNLGQEYPWVSEPITFPSVKKANKLLKKKGLFDDDEEESGSTGEASIFLFVIGGLSYNEIVALERLQSRLSHKLFIGSTNEISAVDFFKGLNEIKSEGDLMFGDSKDEAIQLKSVNIEMK